LPTQNIGTNQLQSAHPSNRSNSFIHLTTKRCCREAQNHLYQAAYQTLTTKKQYMPCQHIQCMQHLHSAKDYYNQSLLLSAYFST